jgi:Mg2+ and Co2+ transporter CorA
MFAPWTTIAGLMGMNVKVPWRDIDNCIPFVILIVFMIVCSSLLLGSFKYLKWF